MMVHGERELMITKSKSLPTNSLCGGKGFSDHKIQNSVNKFPLWGKGKSWQQNQNLCQQIPFGDERKFMTTNMVKDSRCPGTGAP